MTDICAVCKKPINEMESAIERAHWEKDVKRMTLMHVRCAREKVKMKQEKTNAKQ